MLIPRGHRVTQLAQFNLVDISKPLSDDVRYAGIGMNDDSLAVLSDFPQLACPACSASLALQDGRFLCNGECGPVGRLVGGFPCFTNCDYYWGELPLDQMRKINDRAEEVGWEAAVRETVRDQELLHYVCSPHRADFYHHWDLPDDSAILDIGSGWGTIAEALSRKFRRVVAVEGVYERARFTSRRLAQSATGQTAVICSDFMRLPLAPGQFDAVVLNGILEWVGLASKDEAPRALQLRFLRRLHDLLKPTGLVCIGIENRIGWRVFRGMEDHSGLPYTSLMPRPLADWWCRRRPRGFRSGGNLGYRTYTYSLPGYRKLFREAGFRRVLAFQAWNGYNDPRVLLPLADRESVLQFLRNTARIERRTGWRRLKWRVLELLARTPLWSLGASHYVFVVWKD